MFAGSLAGIGGRMLELEAPDHGGRFGSCLVGRVPPWMPVQVVMDHAHPREV